MISKAASDRNNCARRIRFTRDARSAWAEIIRKAAGQRAPTILLPGYIGYTDREGSGVFDPVESASAGYEFYRVRSDLSVDMDQFVSSIQSGRVSMALVIHYFGFCRTDMDEVRRQCRSHGVTLVEDCAHVLDVNRAPDTIGGYGDFSFYSLHKHLPVESGGILRWNVVDGDPSWMSGVDRPPVDVIEQYAITNLDRIAHLRRENYNLYLADLPSDDCDVMFSLGDADIPQSLPLRIRDGQREKLYFYLQKEGMPTIALYYRLIDQIRRQEFPLSHTISGEILNLPVHQDITSEDIARLCDGIRTFFRRGQQ